MVKKFPALLLMLFTMFLLGGISNTKGIILAEVKHTLDLDLTKFGLVVFVFQWGFVLSSFFAGYWSDKHGLKIITLLGSAIMAIGLVGAGLAATVLFFLGFYFVIGLGLGTMTVASNDVVPTVFAKKQAAMFNLAMGIYGVGMFVTPLILNSMFKHGISWRYFYLTLSILLVTFMLYTLSISLPAARIQKIELRAFKKMLQSRSFRRIMLFLIFYISTEVTVTNFLPTYIYSLDLANTTMAQKQHIVTVIMASFSLLFTAGRLLGIFVVRKLGERKTLILFSLLSFLSLAASKLLWDQWIYLFALPGLFLSVLFPTATGLSTKNSEAAGSVIGLVYVAAGVGGATAGWLVGWVSEHAGASMGFNLPILFLIALTIVALFLKDKREGPVVYQTYP